MSTISKCDLDRPVDFTSEKLKYSPFRVARKPRCHPVVQKGLISGNCSKSPVRSRRMAPLTKGRFGEKMTIKKIVGVRETRARLASMGFREGNPVEVISAGGEGILIVLCGGIRLALDRSTAQKIMVSFT